MESKLYSSWKENVNREGERHLENKKGKYAATDSDTLRFSWPQPTMLRAVRQPKHCGL